jgi:4,5-dihydroxyphthalate decarboxylase
VLALNAAFSRNPRTQALLDGRIQPAGADWRPVALAPGEMFFRQLKFAEFDVSELSISSFMIATSHGATPWLGLPVFTTHEFFHAGIMVRADSTIRTPAELRGRRVGVLEYQQTAVIWIRGVLQHEFGVRDIDVEWFMERAPDKSHGGATGFTPPDGVRLTYVEPESSLAALLMAGSIDAILFYPDFDDAIDHRTDGGRRALRTRTLFADPVAEGARYLAKTGITPVNHCVVVRRSLAEEHPWLPAAVFDACRKANIDPAYPYGMPAIRATLEALSAFLFEQRLIHRRVELDELFADTTTHERVP